MRWSEKDAEREGERELVSGANIRKANTNRCSTIAVSLSDAKLASCLGMTKTAKKEFYILSDIAKKASFLSLLIHI